MDTHLSQKLDLVCGVLAAEFRGGMTGFYRTTRHFDVGLDTPLIADVEAVTGFANRNKPASAVYVEMSGVRRRFDGKRWITA